ncbi:hydroxyethylthiazole kinase [Brevibacterium daeguense]|uniref:Hydroxyethylthiazole kinase n=1 Tax=Brevibacterium daeguense TaxID=909936 RepID=A0ABP8EG67_9MICO|nr:hydroxyethylthiazole kinase [Brevibacterium daeguense]
MATPDIVKARNRVRSSQPLIQCITNTVVQQYTANVLLAVGASPAMLDHEADAAQFAAVASGVIINFGTASSQQFLAADAAIEVAVSAGTPWVLDPVSVGGVDYRTSRIRAAARRNPTAVRGNASEIAALAGMGLGGRGVDATDSVDDVIGAAAALSSATGAVVAVSGEVDAIVLAGPDGRSAQVVRVGGGHPLMPLVIGNGCSLAAVTSAYLAAAKSAGLPITGASALEAVVAAHVHFAAAGHTAAQTAQAPGSFAVAFMDALYTVGDAELEAVDLRFEPTEVPA